MISHGTNVQLLKITHQLEYDWEGLRGPPSLGAGLFGIARRLSIRESSTARARASPLKKLLTKNMEGQ